MSQKNFDKFSVILIVAAGLLLCVDCLAVASQPQGKYDALKRVYVKGEYPEPRFPSYLKPPKNVNDVMPFARAAVRQVGGRCPLGLVNPGQSVLLMTEVGSNPVLLQALKKAYEERGVKVHYLTDYDAVGVGRKDAAEVDAFIRKSEDSHYGLREVDVWFGKWEPKETPQEWLKERRPDLYRILYENLALPDHLRDASKKLNNVNLIASGIMKYLDSHPDVEAVFWGQGGRPRRQRAITNPVHQKKYFGSFIFDRLNMLVTRVPSFPGDLWRLVEERTIEPLSWVSRVEAFDPEGTNVYWDMAEDEAASWAKGVYLQGHLFMNPRAASGLFPQSIIDYPALQTKWLPPVVCRVNGVIAGTSNHAGEFPRTELHAKDGYLQEIRGNSPYAEIWREFFKNYPKMHDTTYPLFPKPGYFWLWETAFGTGPKFFLSKGDPEGERNRSGVVHWAFGLKVRHDPSAPIEPKEWADFCRKNKLPTDHWMHIHNKFLTYKVQIRGTKQWLKLVDKGRLTALDDPMVRALASRYGDPDDLLAEEWRPYMPGINVPGNYADFAGNPQKVLLEEVFAKVEKGTYKYFYTPPSMRKKK